MTELIQKRIWDKRYFKLLDDVVLVRMKTPTEDSEFSVKYEDLGLETVIVRKKDASAFFTGLIFLSSFVGAITLQHVDIQETLNQVLFTVFFAFVLFILYLARSDSRKQLLGINGGEKSLALLRKSPNEQTVDEFVNELHERIKKTVIRKRLRLNDPEIDFEYRKMMLDRLQEEGFVKDLEYETLLNQITTKKAPIGFLNQRNN